ALHLIMSALPRYSLSYFSLPRHHRALHSFPTRRSSDLWGSPKCLCPSLSRRRVCPASRNGLRSELNSARESRATKSHARPVGRRSEEHTSELQSPDHLVCRLLLEKKKNNNNNTTNLPSQ